MRVATKSSLAAAIAVTALAAPPASAQTEPLTIQSSGIIVGWEVNGPDEVCLTVNPTPIPNPAPTMTSGGCRAHLTGQNIVFAAHTAVGVEVINSTCNLELNVRVDSAGKGYMTHHEFTQGTEQTCTETACGPNPVFPNETRAWAFYLREFEQEPKERMILLLCTLNLDLGGGTERHCEVTLPITSNATHRYKFSAEDAAGHGSVFPRCEITGELNSETTFNHANGEAQAEQRIEIRHT